MEKQQLIEELQKAISTGDITRNEIQQVLSLEQNIAETTGSSVASRLSLAEIFYYIGGVIILIGLIVLISQNWSSFTFAVKVFTTFGMGIIFFISAILLNQSDQFKKISNVFFLLSGVLIPFGYFIMFDDKINNQTMDYYNVIIPLLCLLQFGITQFAVKKDIFTVFNTVFGTWLFFGLSNYMLNDNPGSFNANFHLYQTILVGISYVLVGYYLNRRGRLFAGWLNTFGVIGILGAGYVLNFMAANSSGPEASVIWTVLYPLLLAGTIISSVYIRNSSFLFVGTICLIAYIIRVTAQNFSDTLGWPFALIVMGVVIMGLGYLAFHLNSKYIKK